MTTPKFIRWLQYTVLGALIILFLSGTNQAIFWWVWLWAFAIEVAFSFGYHLGKEDTTEYFLAKRNNP